MGPVNAPACLTTAFLPGSTFRESDQETNLDSPPTPGFAGGQQLFYIRGAVLALEPPANTTSVSHPSAVDTSVVQAASLMSEVPLHIQKHPGRVMDSLQKCCAAILW